LKIIDNRASSGSKEPGEAFGIFNVLEDQPEEEGDFALYVKSVIVFGRISIVEDRDKVAAITRNKIPRGRFISHMVKHPSSSTSVAMFFMPK